MELTEQQLKKLLYLAGYDFDAKVITPNDITASLSQIEKKINAFDA